MSERPNFEQGAAARGRGRTTGELGRIDPRVVPAVVVNSAPASGVHYSLQTITTGGAFQFARSIAPMVDINGNATRNIEEISFSIWVKMNQNPAATNGMVHFGADAVSTATMGFDWISTVSACFWIFTRSTLANRAQIAVPGTISGTWHHYVGTYRRTDGSGATIRIYLDGDGSTALNGTHATARSWESDHPLEVGRQFFHATSTTLYSAAEFHWLQVWNRQLTSGEAAQLYNGGTPLRQLTPELASGLRLFWKLGDSYQERQAAAELAPFVALPAVSVVDSSGNGFHGQLRSDDSSGAQFPTYIQDSP